MNKKGFAVSIIIYSIVFLIIAILYMLLGIERNRYTVNSELRESITAYLNENVETSKSCEWVSSSQSGLSSCTQTSVYDKNILRSNPTEGDKYYECNRIDKPIPFPNEVSTCFVNEYNCFNPQIVYNQTELDNYCHSAAVNEEYAGHIVSCEYTGGGYSFTRITYTYTCT